MVELAVLAIAVIGIYWVVSSVISIGSGILGIVIPLAIWMGIGWASGKLLRGKGYGPIGDVLLGLLGGVVGNVLFGMMNIGIGGVVGTFAAGIVGAVVFIFVIRLVHDAKFAS